VAEAPEGERHSRPVRTEPLPSLTAAQKAQQEAANTLLQYDRMVELITTSVRGARFQLRPHVIQELNRISMHRLEDDAGRWRDVGMAIGSSRHVPPPPIEVPRYIDELCDYVNERWRDRSALHLAAYVMWRLNWIHPFVDGNGRTTRALSYYVLCSKLGFHIPGVTTVPELVAENKAPYYKALEAADRASETGDIDVSQMERLLGDLLAKQMVEALERASSPYGRNMDNLAVVAEAPMRQSHPKQLAQKPDAFSVKLGALFGGLTLLFFMALILLSVQGKSPPSDARFLIVIVLALSGGLSAGFLGGNASARGSIPIPGAKQHPLRYAFAGGAAVLIVLLVLGKLLFL
jgi:fido (protein-threonine AMPylation protein)